MTRVLVITDNERVQRVFDSLENNGSMTVTSAGTLSEGDEEISAAVPDSVFLQSRISGFSGEIVMRHLKKTLPATTKVTLLAVDPEDAAQARKHRIPVVELWADDEGLKDQVHSAVATEGRKKGTKGRVADRRKTKRAAPTASSAAPAVVPGADAEGEAAVLPVPPSAAEATTEPPAAPITRVMKPRVDDELFTEATEPDLEEQAPAMETDETEPPEPEATSFAELMRRAAAKRAPATPAEVEDRVIVGGASQEAAAPAEGAETPAAAPETAETAPGGFVLAEPPPRLEKHEQAAPSGFVLAEPPAEEQGKQEKGRPAFVLAEEPEEHKPAAAGGFIRGESLAEAYLRTKKQQKQKRPYWIIPLAVALLVVPLVYYLTRDKERPQPAKGVQQPFRSQGVPAPAPAHAPAPAKAPATPAPAAAVPAATLPAPPSARQAPPAAQPRPQAPAAAPAAPKGNAAPVPATSRPAPPATRQAAPQVARPPQPTPGPGQNGGLKTLPPFLTGAKLDPAYGKSHPGWVKYIGPRAQYRLFRKGDTFKALQVIPLGGETIPDQLYQRALLEFGGIDSYQVQSSDIKGNYLVEQGVAKGGVGVTIYRNKSDLGMKALVIYYR